MQCLNHISVRATYNELIFDSSMAGFYYLDVSRRSLQRTDVRLTDYCGKAVYNDILIGVCLLYSKRGDDVKCILHILLKVNKIV